jgi:hypothetical protein
MDLGEGETGGLGEIHTRTLSSLRNETRDGITLTRIHIPTWLRAATDSHRPDSVMFPCTPDTMGQGEPRIGFGEVWRCAVPEAKG